MATYTIDKDHSEIKFRVRYMMINNVTGYFLAYDATMESSLPDFSDAKIYFEADTDSILTNNVLRDDHIRSQDFFHVQMYPKMKFYSDRLIKTEDDNKYLMEGNLSICGITKPITMDVEYHGSAIDPN